MAEEPRYMAPVRDFLELRGYVGLSPRAVERVEGEYCWYLDFDLPEGRLVLQVDWTEAEGWWVRPWDFHHWR